MHRPAAMNVDRLLAEPQRRGDLLADAPGDDLLHDLPLALRKGRKPRFDVSAARAFGPPLRVARQRLANVLDQQLLAERLFEKLGGARLQRPHRDRHVAVPGDDDDRQVRAALHQHTLHFQPAHARHAHVENQAARLGRIERGQKFLRRRERLHFQPDGPQEHVERLAHGGVVVNHEYDRLRLHDSSSVRPVA